ncbi:MAG: FAD-binding oxidoreductase [Solirubrobacterales bacterium]
MTLAGASVRSAALIERELRGLLGASAVLPGDTAGYLSDETEGSGVRGEADAIALPASTTKVVRVIAWCYEHDVAVVPRGGGSGFAGGAVPVDGGVVLSLERMTRVRDFEPLLWRMSVEAGVRTGTVRRLARENGLFFPPDPGAAEQSQIGGNIATNAGGPHAFKYGVTGTWVTGIEAVVPPGEEIRVGGAIRKDVSGYDLKGLLIGSEGTLGVITAAWLRLLPAPEARMPVVAFVKGPEVGCAAIESVLGSGLQPAALEYLDRGALEAAARSFPGGTPGGARFMVIAEADGSEAEASDLRDKLIETLGEEALSVQAPSTPREIDELWRWRDGVSIAVSAVRGAKVSEDIVVPLDHLREAIEGTVEIGRRHRLEACSWGHAGDGNLHSTFLVDPNDPASLARAQAAADDLFAMALQLGGSVSGEHGIGWAKRAGLSRQLSEPIRALHERLKDAFDPKGLLNPGKKLPARHPSEGGPKYAGPDTAN